MKKIERNTQINEERRENVKLSIILFVIFLICSASLYFALVATTDKTPYIEIHKNDTLGICENGNWINIELEYFKKSETFTKGKDTIGIKNNDNWNILDLSKIEGDFKVIKAIDDCNVAVGVALFNQVRNLQQVTMKPTY